MRTRTIRRILVAVRALQASSLPAVLKASQLARACGAELELFHCVDRPLYVDPYSLDGQSPQEMEQQLRQEAMNKLEAIADRVRNHNIKVSVSVEWDSPVYEAIVRRSLHIEADLVIASQHAGRHRAPGVLRLTDWELVRLSAVPVLLVKNSHAYRHPAVLAAVDPSHAFAKPPQLDRQVLSLARTLSHRLHGTLHAVHAFPRIPVAILAPGAKAAEGVTPARLRQIQQRTERSAKTRLNSLLRGTRIPHSRRYLMAGHPIDAIAQAARNSRSAIVVMGAISRSGLKRIFIGNTAERILDELSCDVLVVKPLKFRSPVTRTLRGARFVMLSPMRYLYYS